jgi:hypothetical protein
MNYAVDECDGNRDPGYGGAKAGKRRRRMAGAVIVSASMLCSLTGALPYVASVPVALAAGSALTATSPPDFGTIPVGQFNIEDVRVTNTGATAGSLNLKGAYSTNGTYDFSPAFPWESGVTSCVGDGFVGVSIPAGKSCTLGIFFLPTHFGRRAATLIVPDSAGGHLSFSVSGTGVAGYYIAGAAGEYGTFGYSTDQLQSGPQPLNQPIVGIASVPFGPAAFWLVASDGGVFTAGGAPFLGSLGNIKLHKPIVGIAATPSDGGYWLVASDGGVFTFGDARFYGSTGNVALHKPIVGMAATPDGRGYWLVASDGGIFTFGDARFHGSTGNVQLSEPIVGMTASPRGDGYWLVASDGGIFTFNVPFQGSAAPAGYKDVIGMAATTAPLSDPWLVSPASLGDPLAREVARLGASDSTDPARSEP